jgi:hypothetical protein
MAQSGLEEAAMEDQPYQREQIIWRGITIEVRYCPDWSPSYREIYGYTLAHLEIESINPPLAPLPMTETGYRSHFSGAPLIDEEGGPVAFVRIWLDKAASTPEWKAKEAAARQFSLF